MHARVGALSRERRLQLASRRNRRTMRSSLATVPRPRRASHALLSRGPTARRLRSSRGNYPIRSRPATGRTTPASGQGYACVHANKIERNCHYRPANMLACRLALLSSGLSGSWGNAAGGGRGTETVASRGIYRDGHSCVRRSSFEFRGFRFQFCYR